MMDFDATSMHPSAMWVKKLFFPKQNFAFKPRMIKTYMDAFNTETFNQDGNESAMLKLKFYNPPDLVFQYLRVKEKVKNMEANRMRNGYFIDTLTSVDIQKIVKQESKVIRIYEGVSYRENFKIYRLLEKV